MRKPSSIPTIIVALLALVLFGYANHAAFRSGDHPDAETARQAEINADNAAKSKPTSAAPQIHGAPSKSSNAAAPATELTVGNPAAAQTKITYGYSADDNVEQNPTSLDATISALQTYAESHPSTSLQVVCLDIPAGDLSDKSEAAIPSGLAKNGKTVMSLAATLSPAPLDASALDKELG